MNLYMISTSHTLQKPVVIDGLKQELSMFRALIASTSRISLTDPLSCASLETIKIILQKEASSWKSQISSLDPPNRGTAAVILPLCNVNGRPGILLEVRGKLRTHPGEVR